MPTNIDLVGKLRDVAERQLTAEGMFNDGLALFETWQKEESSVVDERKWVVAGSGTGTITRTIGTATTVPKFYVALGGLTNADTIRLRSRRRWDVGPDTWGTGTIYRKLVAEWEFLISTVASIENTTFFMGFGESSTATRATTNLVGFILTADALNAITDDGVGETVSAVGAPVVTTLHKLRIEIYAGTVDFYVDEVLQATHTTAAGEDLPDQAMYFHLYLPQEAAANGGILDIGSINIWYEGLPVPIMATAAASSSYLKALLARGMIIMQATCDNGMTASATTLVSDDLVGYTDDYFNNHFYAWVIKNANSVGNAPDDERRLITDYTSATGTFTCNPFTANVEEDDVFLVIHESLIDILDTVEAIYDIVNSILVTSETGGTITTDGTEQNLYINNVPAGVYKPLTLKVDMTNMIAGDALVLRCYERVTATGGLVQDAEMNFIGAQDPALKHIGLSPARHGIRTTIQRTALSGAGADKAYDWSVFLDQ